MAEQPVENGVTNKDHAHWIVGEFIIKNDA